MRRKSRIEALLDRVDAGAMADTDAFVGELESIDRDYGSNERRWALYALAVFLDKSEDRITPDDIASLVEQGARDRAALAAAIAQDAGRDFAPAMSVGYGIDDGERRAEDFRAVRGEPKV